MPGPIPFITSQSASAWAAATEDDSILGIQSRAARGLLNMPRPRLAKLAGMRPAGLALLERGKVTPRLRTRFGLVSALFDAGIVLLSPMGSYGPGARFVLRNGGLPGLAQAPGWPDADLFSRLVTGGRELLGLTQAELSRRSGLSVQAVCRLEGDGARGRESSRASIRDALMEAGLVFLEADGSVGPGICITAV